MNILKDASEKNQPSFYGIKYPFTSRSVIYHLVFRTLLQATARPGTVLRTSFMESQEQTLLLILESIYDRNSTFSILGDEPHKKAWSNLISSIIGSLEVPLSEADFVVVLDGKQGDKLSEIRRGNYFYPESGATVFFFVEEINRSGVTLILRGPGIMDEIKVSIEGIPKNDLLNLKELNRDFPLGVESVFIDRTGNFFIIPRSTWLEVE